MTEQNHVAFAADIVAAYVSNNSVSAADLPALIVSTQRAVLDAAAVTETPAAAPEPAPTQAKTPREIKASVLDDALISFIDGQAYKTLGRHLRAHGFTPESYRRQFGLPADYPMVAKNYSAVRSELAKAAGLGRKR